MSSTIALLSTAVVHSVVATDLIVMGIQRSRRRRGLVEGTNNWNDDAAAAAASDGDNNWKIDTTTAALLRGTTSKQTAPRHPTIRLSRRFRLLQLVSTFGRIARLLQ